MQTVWAQQIVPIIEAPINQGIVLTNVSLVAGANVVNHLLGRKLQGWNVVRMRSTFSEIYDTQDSNSQPGLTLLLNSSVPVVVDLYVF